MGASFLITLREGLEVSLVLAILISYLVKSGRSSDVGAVWRGSGAAALMCLIGGIAFNIFVGEFEIDLFNTREIEASKVFLEDIISEVSNSCFSCCLMISGID